MSNRIGIVVDGQGDHAALKTRFAEGFTVMKTGGPRGDAAAIDKIAAASRKEIAMLRHLGHDKVVVLVDFENRRGTYASCLKKLRLALARIDFGIEVEACSSNMMIENWYLANVAYLSKRKNFLRKVLKQKHYEGKHGKRELKKLMAKGYSYEEVRHGAQLFAILQFSVARKNSSSFDAFLRAANVSS